MNREPSPFALIILAAILVFIALRVQKFFYRKSDAKKEVNRKKRLVELKENYSALLKGNDKHAALEAGRKYYSALRDNQLLTIYDEQAIANDLNTMS